MKKLILFIMLMVGFTLTAQTVTLPVMVGTSQLVTTDYTLTNTTVRNFIYTAPQEKPCTQDFVIKLDSLTGNHTNVAVALYGQKSSVKGDWTQIGATVNWIGVAVAHLSADTTIIISNATANRYSSYKLGVTGTGTGTTKVDTQGAKIYLE